jgi:perosamine synthetase
MNHLILNWLELLIDRKIKFYKIFLVNLGDNMEIKNSGRGHGYTQDDISVVINAMETSDPYTQGRYQDIFENKFSEYLGEDVESFAVSSGTAALELAAILSGLGKGDEVIIPAHTFAATAIPFARTGADIVWADIDPNTFVVSSDSIKNLITPKTKVIVVVHLYGLMADMEGIMNVANDNNILVVEDSAQALGAEINGKKSGTFGHFSCFSFHSHKHLSTLGEGGMFVLKDKALAKKINGLKHNGLRQFEGNRDQYWKPAISNVDFDIDGFWPYNFCIGEIQCAVGISVLSRMDALLQKRIDRAHQVIKGLKEHREISFQRTPEGFKNVYYTLPAYINSDSDSELNNDLLISSLFEQFNIKAIVQYCPLYRYPMFIKAGLSNNSCHHTDNFFDNMIALPNHGELTEIEVGYMINSLDSVIKRLK